MENIEIERKFLVDPDKWLLEPKRSFIQVIQGYLSIDPDKVIRVRISGTQGYITIKGAGFMVRPEYEYAIPKADAMVLIQNYCTGKVEKIRYYIENEGQMWEVDEFQGANAGLIVAEIELESCDNVVKLPKWITKEVTGDERFFNSYLSQHPFKTWPGLF
jgi:CYTH domain-containing protein